MKKKKNPDIVTNADQEYLKVVMRKLLKKMESILDATIPVPASAQSLEQYVKACELLFGPKTSLATMLVTLSELFLMLEQSSGHLHVPEDKRTSTTTLSAADIALVEAFVQKMRLV